MGILFLSFFLSFLGVGQPLRRPARQRLARVFVAAAMLHHAAIREECLSFRPINCCLAWAHFPGFISGLTCQRMLLKPQTSGPRNCARLGQTHCGVCGKCNADGTCTPQVDPDNFAEGLCRTGGLVAGRQANRQDRQLQAPVPAVRPAC